MPRREFVDRGLLTTVLKIFIALCLIINAIQTVSEYFEMQFLQNVKDRVFKTEAEAVALGEANDARQFLIGITSIVLIITNFIFLLRWIYTAQVNVRAMGAKKLTISPGWAVGYFFVPFLNLVRPFSAMVELWKSSANPGNWKNESTSPVIGFWWFFWLGSGVAGQISLRMTIAAKDDIDKLILSDIFGIISGILNCFQYLCLFVIVSSIYRFQANFYERETDAEDEELEEEEDDE